MPSLTFIAPVNAVSYNGARPVFIDADEYYNIDAEKTIEFFHNETIFKNGFTYKQTFFIGFAQIWNGIRRKESIRTLVKTDPHPPGEFRTIGTLSNMVSFYSAFGIKDGDGMFLDETKRSKIW